MEILRPAQIERRSMDIIAGELSERGIVLPEETKDVVMRVIHATADFDYAENLHFTDGAASRGAQALAGGATVVSDTNMARAGISRAGLEKLGGKAICYMADPEVARSAKERGVTRATVSFETAAREHPGAVCAVGNAPTALYEIVRQMELGFRPTLVIAVPVGFVNVVEAKQALWESCAAHGVPAIAAMGRKGGSTVAAAVVNALIYRAAGMQDPEKRGW